MFEIISKENLAEDILKYKIKAPRIAKKRKPGQFIVIQADETSERIPLTIVDSDTKDSSITLIFQVVGKSTKKLASFQTGDSFKDLLGPLGKETHLEKFGNVVAIGGGVGIAPLYPIAKGMANANNELSVILGARTKNLLILEEEMRSFCKNIHIITDDGSYGEKGFVTHKLKSLIESKQKIDLVIAIGPLVMMKAVSDLTKPFGIHTIVSLNPIMVDGTGMCGGCRVNIKDEVKFACVDGPEFNGHDVNFEKLSKRLSAYKNHEDDSCKLIQQINKKG
ncbi:ferredoxin-NADP reductase [bacterium B13(2017)]|nr:ferredoxin-NADP reductase [bacterium B13(2017)]